MIYCHKKWFLAVFGAKKWFTGAKNHFLPVQKWFFTQENDFEGTQKWFSWNDFWNILCRFWRCDLLLGKKPFPSEMGISGNGRKSFFSRKCSTSSNISFAGLNSKFLSTQKKLLYVTYSPYKYELERIKTHEMRAKTFRHFFFRPLYIFKELEIVAYQTMAQLINKQSSVQLWRERMAQVQWV